MQDLIPHMAQEYGFQYELITYKWPTWLHKQKEKQRIIWAYKILFLDVIFPLSLKKVSIFLVFLHQILGKSLQLFPSQVTCNFWWHSIQVIFVDADQVVRADMGELYDMDLKGRPLAYTPFCDNNKEMDGYRFWRQVRSMRNDLLNDFLFAEMFSTFIHQFVFHCRRVSGRTICGESLIISGTVQLCIYILSVFAKSTLILFILLIDL